MKLLFLDDERIPDDVTWITLHAGCYDIVRSQKEFEKYLIEHDIPNVISFDNDLGIGMGEGYECAKWMCERVMDGVLTFPDDFKYTVHSKNNIAAKSITLYLDQFLDVHAG